MELMESKIGSRNSNGGDVIDDVKRHPVIAHPTASAVETPPMYRQWRSARRVVLNVGGQQHETLWTTLDRFPNTRLGQLRRCSSNDTIAALCDDFDLNTMQFFFDRNPRSFGSILNFYQTGKLHMPSDVCVQAFGDDLLYWGLDEFCLDACCRYRYQQREETVVDEIRRETEIIRAADTVDENFGSGRCANWRRLVWNLMEKPHTSVAAKLMMLVSLLFIVASLITLPLGTMPQLQMCCDQYGNTVDNLYLEYLERVCIIWFTFEYVVRLLASPSKRRFLLSILNAIDLLVIVTYVIGLVLDHLSLKVQRFVSVRRIILVLRVLRILRILKLAKHSVGLQSIGYTLHRSYREFGLMIMFIAIGVMIFSTLVYFAEKDLEYSNFVTIPDAFWWAIVTMTTVGYGDMVPHTAFGKIIGAMCSISGVLVIALPIPVIVNNFSLFYQEQTRRQKALESRKACNERIHLQPAAGAGAL